jgi:RNA polymerase sigma factor (sigma-70 family)
VSESRAGHLFDTWRRKGDPDALAEVFDLTAPRLLGLAIHLCGDAMEAEDLLQATFLAAMEHAGDYDASRPLLPWLSGILANKARLARRDAAREIDPARLVARTEATPLEEAAQRELSGALAEALDRIDEPYRAVLVLRLRHGLAVGDIAHALGRSPGTVRVQLHRGLKQLRGMLPAGLIASVLLALSPSRGLAAVRAAVLESGAPVSAPLLGVLIMAKKFLLAGALLTALTATWWILHRVSGSGTDEPVAASLAPAAARDQSEQSGDLREPRAAPTLERSAIESPATVEVGSKPPTGSLRVQVRWSDGSPAASIGIDLHSGIDPTVARYECSASTSVDGAASFDDLVPGQYVSRFDRLGKALQAEVTAGETTEIVATIPPKLEIDGLVVGPEQEPIAGAIVWLSRNQPYWRTVRPSDSLPAAVTDSQGRFHQRSTGEAYFMGARAPGFAPSDRKYLADLQGPTAQIVLVLPGAGGAISGIVLASDGSPVANARVSIDASARYLEFRVGQSVNRTVFQSLPVETRSGPDGRFRIEGIEPGRLELRVDSALGAPWSQMVQIEARPTNEVVVNLADAARLSGHVLTADGTPLGGVIVFAPLRARDGRELESDWTERMSDNWSEVLATFEMDYKTASTRADGSFEIAGLPAGGIFAACVAGERGRVLVPVRVEAGSEARVELVVTRGLELLMRCVDLEGKAIAGRLVCVSRYLGEGDARHPGRVLRTDADGRLAVPNCLPVDYLVEPFDHWGDRLPLSEVLRPGPGEHVLRLELPKVLAASVFGRVLDDRGEPLAGARLNARLLGRGSGGSRTDQAGEFTALDLRPGEYRFHVIAPGFPAEDLGLRTLAPGDSVDLGTVKLRPPAWLIAHLRREDSQPVEEPLEIRVTDAGGNEVGFTKFELTLGTAHSSPLAAGDYELRIKRFDLLESRQQVHLEAGSTTHVDVLLRVGGWRLFHFELPPGVEADEIRVRAFDARVVPVEDTRVKWDPVTTTWGRTFEPGRYTIKAESNTGLYGWTEVVVDRTAPDEAIRVVLK